MGMVTFHGQGKDGRHSGLTINRIWLAIPQKQGSVSTGQMRVNPNNTTDYNQKRIDVILWFCNEEPNDNSEIDVHGCIKINENKLIRELKSFLKSGSPVAINGKDPSQKLGDDVIFTIERDGNQITACLNGADIFFDFDHFTNGIKELFPKGET